MYTKSKPKIIYPVKSIIFNNLIKYLKIFYDT